MKDIYKKQQRAEQASQVRMYMERKYSTQINECVKNTEIYSADFGERPISTQKDMKITLIDIDSVSAIFKFSEGKTAVLNFASYKNPGGQFLSGSNAQEECLCHESFLYNVLEKLPHYYEWNCNHKNRALYTNRALYSSNVVFERNGETCNCDVLTCAAPNWNTARKYGMATAQENNKVLIERILFVLNIAASQKVDTLILGAFGCGVFAQNPEVVARVFKYYLKSTHQCFSKVIFAIPDKTSKNYIGFDEIFNQPKTSEPRKETSLFN